MSALKNDRWLFLGGLALVEVLALAYTAGGAGMQMSAIDMTRMASFPGQDPQMGMSMGIDWTLSYAVLIFFMWWIMMIAMMVPSAAPTLLLHRSLSEKTGQPSGMLPTWTFVGGYLAIWAVFSAAAAGLQWLLQTTGMIVPSMMTLRGGALTGSVLVLVGLYQFSPLKHACLRHCEAPARYLAQHWRGGVHGGWQMGLHHGAYCLGCCWALMLLLFVGGIMNLYWIAGLALLVGLEKTSPFGHATARISGGAMIMLGTAMAVAS